MRNRRRLDARSFGGCRSTRRSGKRGSSDSRRGRRRASPPSASASVLSRPASCLGVAALRRDRRLRNPAASLVKAYVPIGDFPPFEWRFGLVLVSGTNADEDVAWSSSLSLRAIQDRQPQASTSAGASASTAATPTDDAAPVAGPAGGPRGDAQRSSQGRCAGTAHGVSPEHGAGDPRARQRRPNSDGQPARPPRRSR
jgi:hypothetical protein